MRYPFCHSSDPEKADTVRVPDFHRLVNYPDYLIKNYPDFVRKTNPKVSPNATEKSGKRHCVMCGRSRVCSGSSARVAPSPRVRVPQRKTGEYEEEQETYQPGDDNDTMHIIPRQNKGLCTACDVSVWVVKQSGLEIKWCKGCKNFRPWAAFGDKGMATKCCRCRERQREKYASQKDVLRSKRQQQKSTTEEKVSENPHHEMEAAKGLRDLMAAAL